MSASEDLLHQSRCVTLSGVVRTPCAARLQRPQAAYGYQWLCRSISRLVKEIAERRLIGGYCTLPTGGSWPIGDGQPVLGQCFDVRPPGSISLLRRKRLCCLFAHVTQLKLPTNNAPARSRPVGYSA